MGTDRLMIYCSKEPHGRGTTTLILSTTVVGGFLFWGEKSKPQQRHESLMYEPPNQILKASPPFHLLSSSEINGWCCWLWICVVFIPFFFPKVRENKDNYFMQFEVNKWLVKKQFYFFKKKNWIVWCAHAWLATSWCQSHIIMHYVFFVPPKQVSLL